MGKREKRKNRAAGEHRRTLRWMRLDNAAKIYPAARRADWSNVFRLSATLKEEVDRAVLSSALAVTVRRFPSIAARLRRGAFWYYLQEVTEAPHIMDECGCPLTPMTHDEIRSCALRVILYKNRIAVEIFHSLTDGTGALVFLKTLVAEYLQQKHGIAIPNEHGILSRTEEPDPEELEDSFQKYSGPVAASRKEHNAWHITGTREPRGITHLTCFTLEADAVLGLAKARGVSVTAFLTAAMLLALQAMQKEKGTGRRRRRYIRVLIPVNLRQLFPSRTLRNFAMYTTPELDTRLGEYGFDEICSLVRHHMGAEITPKKMAMKIATNVDSERLLIVKVLPLFVKNAVMKAIFDAVGEKKSCLTLSNLGRAELPPVMAKYVERLDFILGVQAEAPYNCGVITFGNKMNINFIRNTKESLLEYHFHRVLKELGITAFVQSNAPGSGDAKPGPACRPCARPCTQPKPTV